MNETWIKIQKTLRHNQFITAALVIVVVALAWVYGCDSTTKAPWDAGVKVTRQELAIGIEEMNAKIKLANADLDKQDLFKQQLFDTLAVVAEGGTVNPMGVGIGLLGVLGVGAVADNRKKNAVIKTLKRNGGTANGTNGSTTNA